MMNKGLIFFIFLDFGLRQKMWCDGGMISITVTVTQSYNIEKNIEDSKTDDVI